MAHFAFPSLSILGINSINKLVVPKFKKSKEIENLWSSAVYEHICYLGTFGEYLIVLLLRTISFWLRMIIVKESVVVHFILKKKNFNFIYLWFETDLLYVIWPSFCENGPKIWRVYVNTYLSGVQFNILFELQDTLDGVNKLPDSNYCVDDYI